MMQIRSRLAFRSPISYSIATVLALFAMIMLAACGESPTPTPGVTPTVTAQANAGTPPDLTVTYEYRAGTMPPPYHNEYTVVIGPGTQGMVKYSPDYPGDTTPIWDELFSPTAEQLNQLYALILKNNLLRSGWRELDMPPVGGDTEWATIHVNGETRKIPVALQTGDESAAAELYAFVKEQIVPKTVWDSLEAQRADWQKTFEENTP